MAVRQLLERRFRSISQVEAFVLLVREGQPCGHLAVHVVHCPQHPVGQERLGGADRVIAQPGAGAGEHPFSGGGDCLRRSLGGHLAGARGGHHVRDGAW